MKRKQTELRNWRFQVDQNSLGEDKGWYLPAHDKSGWMEVDAPKAWDLYEPAFWGYEGIGWYAAELEAGWIDADALQTVVFNSVSGHARVWVNGAYLGEHYGSYLPFAFAVTPHLRGDGLNEIVLRVDNRHREEWLPGGPVVEWVQYGSILQKVTLDTTARQHISSVRMLTKAAGTGSATVACEMEIVNASAEEWEGAVTVELPVRGGKIVRERSVRRGPNEAAAITIELEIADPQLWELDRPFLYTLSARLADRRSAPLDEVSQRFGIRTIETDGHLVKLNGRPITIKGFNRYDEFAGYGPVVPEAVIREELIRIKETGANMIRVHYPQAPVHLDIMDEIGLLLMEEVPLNWWLPEGRDRPFIPEVVDKAEQALEDMVRRDWNHPCVVAWSMCNESGTNSADGISSMRRLMRKARALDPSRLVTFVTTGSPGHEAFDEADLVCINLYYGLFHGKLALDISDLDELVYAPTRKHIEEMIAEYAGKPVIMTEFGTHGVLGLKGNERFTETYQAAYLEKVWNAIADSGAQGGVVWCWADYYHRRDFIGTSETMWGSPYGPYGVVTIDRREKESLRTITRLFKSAVPVS